MRGIIEELRRRNVFRVGVAYVVTGWLFVQVADVAADAFNTPDWFMQMLIIVLLVGLPVSLFLSWAYELTPDGLMKTNEVPADALKDPRSGRILNIIIIATLTVAVLWLGWDKLQRPVTTEVTDKSIAVLPFEDFSPDGDHAWFADGLTEEILNSLARTPDLLIASRTSSFSYRDTTLDIPTIAAQLNVAHILEGSVRRSDDRLRVTAQLIRVADDTHLWSENFDSSSEDSIEIQERIAIEIANALETAMDPEELAKMMSAGTRSVEAWETYLRGLAVDQANSDRGGGDAEGVLESIALFDKAVELDPGFGDAHLMLADVWETQINPTSILYINSDMPLAERQARFNTAINAAIKYARSDMSRLEAELRAADFEVRIIDQIDAAIGMTEVAPERRQGWAWVSYLYMSIGEYDKAREAGLKAWAAPDEVGSARATIIQIMHRVNVEDTIHMVDEALATANPPANLIYQSHRALLYAGMVERAAQVAEDYLRQSDDFEGRKLVQIRQACAEGRVADADKLFEEVDPESNSIWLFLKILGRDDEARDLLMPLDTPETIFILSGYMTYRSFEARNFPLLWKKLTAQGIDRPEARLMPYRCER